jgi:hypothetical protein
MGKTILTYNDLYEINQKLEENELEFKLHLHDVCGSQSFTLELLRDDINENNYDKMKYVIENFFEEKHIKVEFLENNLEFVIK